MAHPPRREAAKITNRGEEYLETILNMIVEGKDVFAARLAERLDVSAPTVSAALGRLSRDGLVSIDPQRRVSLTEVGRKAAITIVRRHRLVERLLTDYLGLAWSDCHQEACLLEHAISPRVEERLYQRLGRPATCPHGNPIPEGMRITMPECQELTSIPEGTIVKVVRITEEVSDDHTMMEFLQKNRLMPGMRFLVQSISLPADTMTLRRTDDRVSNAGFDTEAAVEDVTISFGVAGALFVSPV